MDIDILVFLFDQGLNRLLKMIIREQALEFFQEKLFHFLISLVPCMDEVQVPLNIEVELINVAVAMFLVVELEAVPVLDLLASELLGEAHDEAVVANVFENGLDLLADSLDLRDHGGVEVAQLHVMRLELRHDGGRGPREVPAGEALG